MVTWRPTISLSTGFLVGFLVSDEIRQLHHTCPNTDFKQRCRLVLVELAGNAMGSQNYDEATEYFSIILLLDPANHVDILMKRIEAQRMMESWVDALKDADEVYTEPHHRRQYW